MEIIVDILGHEYSKNILQWQKEKAEKIKEELEFLVIWARARSLSNGESKPYREGGISVSQLAMVQLWQGQLSPAHEVSMPVKP